MTEHFIKQAQKNSNDAFNSLSRVLHIADDENIIYKNFTDSLKNLFLANFCLEKLAEYMSQEAYDAFFADTDKKATALSLGLDENASDYMISQAQNMPDFASIDPLESDLVCYNGRGKKISKKTIIPKNGRKKKSS